MQRASTVFALLMVLTLAYTTEGRCDEDTPGPLVAVGGGSTTQQIREKILELAGQSGLGPSPAVLVVAQASARENAAAGSVNMWREHQLDDVAALEIDNRDIALRQIAEADILWMPGGSQNRLMQALRDAHLIDAIRERHKQGAIVGGTSAGAAVLSELMITGEADLESIRARTTELADGLQLRSDVIIDQHFVARRRFNRLLSAVLDQPHLLGIGIDESTAAIFIDNTIQVIGRSSVTIIDAREATQLHDDTQPGDTHAATGITMHVLTDGMSQTLASKQE